MQAGSLGQGQAEVHKQAKEEEAERLRWHRKELSNDVLASV
jgi:hypothetical protein